jgi:adenosylhomocysteine nucleosidase
MRKLFLAPLKAELSILSHAFQQKWKHERLQIQSHTALYFPEVDLYLAVGGLGKVDMAIKTQFWLTQIPDCKLMACVGSAGSLDSSLKVGDIIVASKTIEHDFKQIFFKKPLPEFPMGTAWADFLQLSQSPQIHHAPIASGDEDILSAERRLELSRLTGAQTVAWEGAGAARACAFLNIPFCEIRGITDDLSNDLQSDLKQDFTKNLNHALANLAEWLLLVCSK